MSAAKGKEMDMNLFGFIQDVGNYETRKVAYTNTPHGWIDTCACSDGKRPYETAIEDSRYVDDEGKRDQMCIVEAYDTKGDAQRGHDRWVKKITTNPPATLTDCLNAGLGQLASDFGVDFNWTFKP